MVKWLKLKTQTIPVYSVSFKNDDGGLGYYHFEADKEKGTALPDKFADQLLASGNYVELNTPWHQERRKQIEMSAIKKAYATATEPVKKILEGVLGKEAKKEEKKEGKGIGAFLFEKRQDSKILR